MHTNQTFKNERTESKSKIENERLLLSLRCDRFGNALSNTTKHFLNLSDYDLSDTESSVLSHDLNFGLPPRYLRKDEIFAEFETLWAQLLHHSASPVEQCTALKARLANLAHLYCDSTIDSRDFTMHKECFCSMSRLVLHRAAIQTSFCLVFSIFLLVCFRRLSTLLPPLCVILVFTMCIRVLLLYVSKITHTYFYFFIRAR